MVIFHSYVKLPEGKPYPMIYHGDSSHPQMLPWMEPSEVSGNKNLVLHSQDGPSHDVSELLQMSVYVTRFKCRYIQREKTLKANT